MAQIASSSPTRALVTSSNYRVVTMNSANRSSSNTYRVVSEERLTESYDRFLSAHRRIVSLVDRYGPGATSGTQMMHPHIALACSEIADALSEALQQFSTDVTAAVEVQQTGEEEELIRAIVPNPPTREEGDLVYTLFCMFVVPFGNLVFHFLGYVSGDCF